MSQPNSTAQPTVIQELSLVNPLYGPGTVLGWYLTALGVHTSWIFHPEKRSSDSTSADFIAVLTLPSVALGHYTSLMHHQLPWKIENEKSGNHWDPSLQPEQFAAYAPFVLMRAFILVSIPMYGCAATNSCLKRTFLV